MRFVRPFDATTGGPGTGDWTSGNPAAGLDGSVPPAEAFDHPMREMCDVIDTFLGDGSFGSAQDPADLTQLRQAIEAHVSSAIANALSGAQAPGTYTYTAGSTPPPRTFDPNGAEVSRTVYPELFAAIGTLYGAGDGATTYNLPRVGGLVFRAIDTTGVNDAGRVLGSTQLGAVQNHRHFFKDTLVDSFDGSDDAAFWPTHRASGQGGDVELDGRNPEFVGGGVSGQLSALVADETRMMNIAVRAWIYY